MKLWALSFFLVANAQALPMQGNNADLAKASLKGAGAKVLACPTQLIQDKQNTYVCGEFPGTLQKAVGSWDEFAELLNYEPGTEWEDVLNPIGKVPNHPRNNGLARGYYFQDTKFLFVTAPISTPNGTVQNRMLMYLSVAKNEPQVKGRPLQ